ncbi:spermidine synthase [Celerinatantimonas sp. YJH-8]|uniref:spermidine synthase n=1 Tax=Celerinatantimonas sp. YJH-8 TaxID=3228714 RepID=UPI0038BF032C
MKPKLFLKTTMLAIFASILSSNAQSKVIHHERSLYRDLTVTEQHGLRCLQFNAVRGDHIQTCQYLDADDPRLVFHYTRMSLAGLLLDPQPRRILIVGLGGGSLPTVLHQLYPKASIDIVELDPAVVKVAHDYFHFTESDKMTVHVADARVFIKRAGLAGNHYDFILLDAFNGDYIPEHLMTKEFLEETRQLMSPDGIVVANTFSTSKLYAYESVTYRQVFGTFYNFKIPSQSGNRIIIASKQPLLDQKALKARAETLEKPLATYGVSIKRFPHYLSTKADWKTDVPPLTDQYSPANLLR